MPIMHRQQSDETAQQDKLSSDDLDRISERRNQGTHYRREQSYHGHGGKILAQRNVPWIAPGPGVLEMEAGVDVSDRAAIVAANETNPAFITAIQTAEAGAFKPAR